MNFAVMFSFCFLFLSLQFSIGQFEGVVESHNVTTDETGVLRTFVMTIWVKKDKVKVQTTSIGSEPASTMIHRNDMHVSWMLNEDEKTFLEVPVPNMQSGDPSTKQRKNDHRLMRTGKKRNVLGYHCLQFVLQSPDQQTTIWATTQLKDVSRSLSSALGEEQLEMADMWGSELSRMGMYPLISSTKVDGRVVESQEITKIERRILNTDIFELPAGYRKQRTDERAR